MIITNKITVDMQRRGISPRVDAVQNEVNSRSISLTLTENGEKYTIPEGASPAVAYKKPDGTSGLYDTLPDGGSAVSVDGSVVTVILAEQVLTCPGIVKAAIVFMDAQLNRLSSFPLEINVESDPSFGKPVSNNYYNYQTLGQVNEAVDKIYFLAENLFQASENGVSLETSWELGSIKSENGKETTTLTNRLRSDYIEINDIVIFPGSGYKVSAFYYNENKEYVSGSHISFTPGSINVKDNKPENSSFFRIVVARLNEEDLSGKESEVAKQIKILLSNSEYVDGLIFQGRSKENLVPNVNAHFVGKVSDVREMPDDSWMRAYGSEFMPILGDGFTWELTPDAVYVLTKQRIDNSISLYSLLKISGLERYHGYTKITSQTIIWNDVSVGSEAGDAFCLDSQNAMELYTEFLYTPGRWTASGTISSTGYHSQMIPVSEEKTYYIGYRGESASVTGAFFDGNKNWIKPLLKEETTIHEYQNADGNNERSNYAEIYTFTVPDGVRYFSLNLTDDAKNKYRQYLSTKPVFALENTGNYVVKEEDPVYQSKKNKSLCVIGASGVTIDRLYINDTVRNIVGFQEYLVPWYKKVGSYGFWSGSWAQYDENDPSIYSGIVGAGVYLSEYDEFILIPSTADVEITGIGEIDSTNTGNYMGGLNGVIEYIYSQSPLAKIYLANAVHKGKYFTDTEVKERMDEINEKLAKLSAFRSYQLIDLVSGMGINDKNYVALTYDGTHLNQEGSKNMGLFIRREILGF